MEEHCRLSGADLFWAQLLVEQLHCQDWLGVEERTHCLLSGADLFWAQLLVEERCLLSGLGQVSLQCALLALVQAVCCQAWLKHWENQQVQLSLVVEACHKTAGAFGGAGLATASCWGVAGGRPAASRAEGFALLADGVMSLSALRLPTAAAAAASLAFFTMSITILGSDPCDESTGGCIFFGRPMDPGTFFLQIPSRRP